MKPAVSTKQTSTAIKDFKSVVAFYKTNSQTVLLIALVCFIGYVWGLGGQFIKGDDTGLMTNPVIHDYGESLKTYSLSTILVSTIYQVFRLNPFPYHLAILLFHIANALLVLLLVFLLMGKRYALVSALLFAVLPAGGEAVLWLSGMGYVFYAFFAYLIIIGYFIFKKTGSRTALIFSLTCYLLSLVLLKSTWLLTVPFIIIALDLFDGSKLNLKTIKTKWSYAGYIVISLLFWLVWVSWQFSTRVTALVTDYYYRSEDSAPLVQRVPYTLSKAFELYVFPVQLSFYHEEPVSQPIFILMNVFIIVLAITLTYLLYKRSAVLGIVLAIIASILPTLSPVQVAWFISDRYLYLGGAFVALLFSLILYKLEDKIKLKNLALYVTALLIALYSVRLAVRAYDFRTSKNLWLATQKTDSRSYRIYNNLGDEFSTEQNWPMAIASFSKSVELNPNYADAIHNLGLTYMKMGDLENAKKYLLESYAKNPKLYQSLIRLAQIEESQGNKEKALEYYTKAIELNPELRVNQ